MRCECGLSVDLINGLMTFQGWKLGPKSNIAQYQMSDLKGILPEIANFQC